VDRLDVFSDSWEASVLPLNYTRIAVAILAARRANDARYGGMFLACFWTILTGQRGYSALGVVLAMSIDRIIPR
jgi:hypothetical protein